jgi:ribonuclease D
VQVCGGGETFIFDALRLRADDLRELGSVLGRTDVEWVLHAGLQDVALLREAFQLDTVPSLFDTQVGWALISAEAQVSLAYLKYKTLGLRSMKPHQADDWLRRPLPESQLVYAAEDIEHLPAITQHIEQKASHWDRSSAIGLASREQLLPVQEVESAELTLADFRNAWQLSPKHQAALRQLIAWYNDLGDDVREDTLSPKTFLAIASRLPGNVTELGSIKGVPHWWAQRHGRALVADIRGAVHRAQAGDFVPIEPLPYATFEEIRLDAWLEGLRAEVCAELSVAPDLAFPPRLMRQLHQHILRETQTESAFSLLTGWRRAVLQQASLCYCRAVQFTSKA